MPPVIHFNHAGASILAPETVELIVAHLRREAELGPMEAGAAVADRLEAGYARAARLLGCAATDVAFGTGHGQLYGDILASVPLKAGDRVLVSRQEWIGNVLALKHACHVSGASMSVMPWDETTAVDVEAVVRSLDPDVKIVALTWVGASGALINPAEALGKALRQAKSGAFYMIDASQAIGQLPVDVSEIGCDVLVACGRKFLRGPRGTALAYISPRLAVSMVPRRVDDRSAKLDVGRAAIHQSAQAVETAEFAVALRLGLIDSLERALSLNAFDTRVKLNALATELRNRLTDVPGVNILDLGRDKAAFVTFAVEGIPCQRVKELLAARGITIGKNGVGYTPFDMDIRGITEILRASVHFGNTDTDIEKLVQAVREIAAEAAEAA
ncbi:aminotransferase class V-fold PLP-dependent enzyme [Ensifer sp. T173]|uniref:Aminotransferase class V-fold PLP-dependent enzyme n=1 Tax=Ensifer canadensis TaxID=555315 RepID=A0AAW4FXD9_9HYPH|nr:aminotransferase class V-fold PLP-dependent enzyme [Ensifer canadensis]MBM3096026.1 aminotransferase class V-fold PLP-dependent enzyme [Ensifer canadensis]UBI79974.1 aminotransferase class V-fold PLP-dependent enzyme [Ensifer canadensis]